ncbi:MAG: hypothetical protein ABSC08_02730 [Bryobacteraceae bacterium]|jgi:hypothetical protein
MNRGIRIDVGSAARAAEQSREADATERGEFKPTAGIRVARAVGQKFELPVGPATGPGEALPIPRSAAQEQASKEEPTEPKASGAPLTSRIAGVFRGLFRRGSKKP